MVEEEAADEGVKSGGEPGSGDAILSDTATMELLTQELLDRPSQSPCLPHGIGRVSGWVDQGGRLLG